MLFVVCCLLFVVAGGGDVFVVDVFLLFDGCGWPVLKPVAPPGKDAT